MIPGERASCSVILNLHPVSANNPMVIVVLPNKTFIVAQGAREAVNEDHGFPATSVLPLRTGERTYPVVAASSRS